MKLTVCDECGARVRPERGTRLDVEIPDQNRWTFDACSPTCAVGVTAGWASLVATADRVPRSPDLDGGRRAPWNLQLARTWVRDAAAQLELGEGDHTLMTLATDRAAQRINREQRAAEAGGVTVDLHRLQEGADRG